MNLNIMGLKSEILNLIRKTATEMPEDVISALISAKEREGNPLSKNILSNILENIELAKRESKPICQDTGVPIFYIRFPANYPSLYSHDELTRIIDEAINIATTEVLLRPNAVDCLSDKNIGNKPIIHFEEFEESLTSSKLEIGLMLKGGGSENVSAIYQLPNIELKAERNLEGVRRCVLDAVFKAQGKGCPPYIIGVAIGGTIEETASLSKKELMRSLNDNNKILELKQFEEQLLEEINSLGIGPMGLGGNSTALSVKITSSFRHPASFFVGVSISCWCLRRQSICLN